jgi:hypothetical protein
MGGSDNSVRVPAVAVGMFIVLLMVALGLGLAIAFGPKKEYVHNYFSSNGKCYDMTVRVGWSQHQETREVPCSEKPQ